MSTPVDHARTGRLVAAGVWVCAAIVMTASAANGALTFDALQSYWPIGLAIGVAVDIALCVALVGDRALHLAGRKSGWGRALRIATAGMSLALNCGASLADDHYAAAVFHAFLPILLVVLTEASQSYSLRFHAIADEHRAAEAAEEQTRQAETDEAERIEREAREVERAADDARRAEAAELARQEREHQERQLVTLLALTPQLTRRRQRPAPARAKAPRQTKTPATKPQPNQAPDLARLVERARPLVADGMGRTQVARQLGVTAHWARRAIDQVEAERAPHLTAVERSA